MSNIIKLNLSNISNLSDTPTAYTGSVISMNLTDGGKGASRGRSLKKSKSLKKKTPSPLRSKSPKSPISTKKTEEILINEEPKQKKSTISKLKNLANLDTVKEVANEMLYTDTDVDAPPKMSLFESNLRKQLDKNPGYISILGKILTEYATQD